MISANKVVDLCVWYVITGASVVTVFDKQGKLGQKNIIENICGKL